MSEIKVNYSINEMQNAIIKIIEQMKSSNWLPEIILSINRGGCIPGVYLSHRIEKPHKVIDIQLRDSLISPNFSVLNDSLSKNKRVLIIDDINDTGKTFSLIKNHSIKFKSEIHFAALINNVKSKVKIEYQGQFIDKAKNPSWYIFPWEKW
jgi:hypoxanthine phosphoribosyltransferase